MSISRACGALLVISMGAGTLHAQTESDAEATIRQIVVEAYVDGVFRDRDEDAVRAGFHPEFVMTVRRPDGVIVATLDMWLERLGLDGTPSEAQITHRFRSVDVTGETAVVKLEILQDGTHLYTDYLGLYRFPDGWRIVNKVFQSHD